MASSLVQVWIEGCGMFCYVWGRSVVVGGTDDGKWRTIEGCERGKMDFGFGVASEA